MKDNKIGQILVIGLVVLVLLVAAKYMFVPSRASDARTINAVGTAESTATPDQAEVYARIDVLKQTADEAAAESKTASNAVVEALKKFEGTKVETTGYNIYKREDWTENGSVFKGYVATYNLKVTTKDMAQVGKIIDAAVENGANGIDSVQFTLSKDLEEKVRAEVLKKAGETARMKAEATAAGIGVKLGNIVSVSESNFYMPPMYYAKAVEAVSSGGRAADLAIEPSSIQVSASLNVAYEIRS